jgi:hypothetical protein
VRNASHHNELWTGNPAIARNIVDFLAGRVVSNTVLDVPPPVFATRSSELLGGKR